MVGGIVFNKTQFPVFFSNWEKSRQNSIGNGAKFRPSENTQKKQPIETFQELMSTEFLHNFPILSFLLLFQYLHPNTGGQIFIGNLLQPFVTFQELISTEFLHNFPILSFLLLFQYLHPNNGGQTYIGNLLQPIVTFQGSNFRF